MVVTEINENIPPPLRFVVKFDPEFQLRYHFYGYSISALEDLCEKHGIGVTLFYSWQKLFFENGHAAFTLNDKRRKADTDAKDQQLADLPPQWSRQHQMLGLAS